jgi:hypothetical protein
MYPPRIEEGGPSHKAAPDSALSQETVYSPLYRRDGGPASHLVVYRLDSKDERPSPELWEEAYEARVSLLAQEAAETERENEHLRSRLALADDELEMRRKMCRCRRWTK